MDSIEDLAQTMDSISKSTLHGDVRSCMRLAAAARKLTERLEQPWERMFITTMVEPQMMASAKIATDVKLWAALSATPQTSAELAKKTGTEHGFLRRILRLLVATGSFEEVGVDAFVETDLSKALAPDLGLRGALDMYYTFAIKQTQRMPEYFKQHGYRFPEEIDQAPWKWIIGKPDFQGGYWEMLDEMDFGAKFNSLLDEVRMGMPSWPRLWPVKEKLLDGWDGQSVLLVDVGGGKGADISNLGEMIHETLPNARLVLQDRPSVLEEVKASGLHAQVETMPHDFFQPNPVHGARAYFVHSVVHDWPDKEARAILENVKVVMVQGYSKLLLMEVVMPDSCNEVDSKLAAIDLQMGLNFCALERTEGQWKALLESVGLKYMGHQVVFSRTCIIEAELP